jgi:hypothetical protein
MKIRRDCWGHDPARVRLGRYDVVKRLKRSSLIDPERIERSRWKALDRLNSVALVRWRTSFERIHELGEAFVQVTGEGNYPQRIKPYAGRHSSVSYDSYYWEKPEREPVPHSGSAIEQLAEAEAEAQYDDWWEAELSRRLAAITDEQYAAGSAYVVADSACRIARRRVNKLNAILAQSLEALDFLPRGRDQDHRNFMVELNGRHYLYETKYGRADPLMDKWPDGVGEAIIKVPTFKLDESCIGKERDAIRTRFGEPPIVLGTSKADFRPNVWIYGSAGLRFSRRTSKVESIYSPKAVSSLLRRAM